MFACCAYLDYICATSERQEELQKIMKFSERIRILRKERGITQKETAAGLGIGYRAYQCYELNQRYPDIHGLINIANFFGVSLDYLVGLSDVRERQ